MKKDTDAAPEPAPDVPAEAERAPEPPRRTGPGRPRLCDEDLRVVAFKVPVSVAASFDEMLARIGETRSSRLRTLVERDIAANADAPEDRAAAEV